MALLNLHDGVPGYPTNGSFTAQELGYPAGAVLSVRDVIARANLGTGKGPFTFKVPTSSVLFLRVARVA